MDLKLIIGSEGVSYSEIAIVLFPLNAYPKKALTRLLRSQSLEFKSDQLLRLASYLGEPVSDLLNSRNWRHYSRQRCKSVYINKAMHSVNSENLSGYSYSIAEPSGPQKFKFEDARDLMKYILNF